MAQPAAMARAVVVFANTVGLVGIAFGNHPASRRSNSRAAASEPDAGRDADRLRIGCKSPQRVDGSGARNAEGADPQPAERLAGDAIPAGNRLGFGFWTKVNTIAHRGRPCARATAIAMLGPI